MKNLKLTLLVVITFATIFSCTTDNSLDNEDALTVGSLLGAWKLTSSTENGIATELSACDLSDLIIFDETKLMYVHNKNGERGNCQIETSKKDYTVRDNVITEGDGTEIIIQQIYTLEPSSLVLEFTETYNDVEVTYKETYIKRY